MVHFLAHKYDDHHAKYRPDQHLNFDYATDHI